MRQKSAFAEIGPLDIIPVLPISPAFALRLYKPWSRYSPKASTRRDRPVTPKPSSLTAAGPPHGWRIENVGQVCHRKDPGLNAKPKSEIDVAVIHAMFEHSVVRATPLFAL